jgi:hypothetical protein
LHLLGRRRYRPCWVFRTAYLGPIAGRSEPQREKSTRGGQGAFPSHKRASS